MPARELDVNLLGQDVSDHTPVGRLITWILTYGRYIMIMTELVVLVTFISRFSLDRKLTDLNEEISQKQEILAANQDLENEIRSTQAKIKRVGTLIKEQPAKTEAIYAIHTLLPAGVYFSSLNISKEKIAGNVIAVSTTGFAQLLSNLGATDKITQIEIGSVDKRPVSGIEFSISAKVPGTEKK